MTQVLETHIIHCHECGLQITVENLPACHKAHCPRCGHKLTEHRPNAQERILVFAITALIFLGLSLPFEFISFSAAGQTQTITVPQSIIILIQNQYWPLALLQFLLILLLPLVIILTVMYLMLCKYWQHYPRHLKPMLSMVYFLLPWSMAEIFLLGVLVSLIKIISMADIALGFSFFAFMGFVIANTAMLLNIDKHQLHQWFDKKIDYKTHTSENHSKNTQATWALLLTAAILYIPANLWPIMQTSLLGNTEPSTIMGGVILLWKTGSYPIAAVIFIASVLVPTAKLVILAWLNMSVQSIELERQHAKTFWYRMTELVGKWSMVDVFVVAILVSLVQLGGTMAIYPGPAALAFSGVVIATMLAAHSFNPIAIWAKPKQHD